MHRFTSIKGIELIKQFEGFRAVTYICSGGYPTIGYGHKISAGESFEGISEVQAEEILTKDLLQAEKAVIKYINRELSDNQFDALVSFTFNLGSAALQRSTLRQKINYGAYLEAKDEFGKWVYAKGRKLPGLITRRFLEARLFAGELA